MLETKNKKRMDTNLAILYLISLQLKSMFVLKANEENETFLQPNTQIAIFYFIS